MTTERRYDAEWLAETFHETYERLAPEFGYETRCESAVPWDSVPESNRNLMVAVARELIEGLAAFDDQLEGGEAACSDD